MLSRGKVRKEKDSFWTLSKIRSLNLAGIRIKSK